MKLILRIRLVSVLLIWVTKVHVAVLSIKH